MQEELDEKWHERERELRWTEAAVKFSTSADRLTEAVNGLRNDLTRPPNIVERLTLGSAKRELALVAMIVALAAAVASCTALAWGIP